MNQTKLWTVVTLAWLCTLFTIERLHEPMNIASFVYVMVAALAVGVVLLPRISGVQQALLTMGSVATLLIGKIWLEYPVWGGALPITVTEVVAISTTIVLACRVQRSLQQLGQSALRVALAEPLSSAHDFEQGQIQIYRDLRVARRNDRSLSLLTIAPRLDDSTQVPDRLIQEMVQRFTGQYLRGRMAQTLAEVTGGCATVLGRNDHLIVAMPEMGEAQGQQLLEQVRDRLREQVGVEIDAGLATFPDHEITLNGLLDRAETNMRLGARSAVIPKTSVAFPMAVAEYGS